MDPASPELCSHHDAENAPLETTYSRHVSLPTASEGDLFPSCSTHLGMHLPCLILTYRWKLEHSSLEIGDKQCWAGTRGFGLAAVYFVRPVAAWTQP